MSDNDRYDLNGEGKHFHAFLQKKKATEVCPVCAAKSWGIVSKEGRSKTGVNFTTGKPSVIAFYLIFCTNCGYTRFHLSDAVDEPPEYLAYKARIDKVESEGQ